LKYGLVHISSDSQGQSFSKTEMQSDPSSSSAYTSSIGRSDPVASADETTAALLSLNGLSYTATDTSLSVVQSRTVKRFDATRPTVDFGGGMMTFSLNTGNQFLNARTSYIWFQIKASATDKGWEPTFGTGNLATTIVEEFTFTHSSGNEIERIRDANSWYQYSQAWKTNPLHYDNVQPPFGSRKTPLAPPAVGNSTTNWVIPLYLLSDLFNQNVLLPPYLIAGSRIDLQIATLAKAIGIVSTADAVVGASAQILRPQIFLDLYTVTDGVMRSITAIASTSGLDLDFSSVWDTQQAIGQEKNPVISVNKALSMAQSAHCILREERSITTQSKDSFQSVAEMHGATEVRYVLGSMFMPLQGLNTSQDTWMAMMHAWGYLASPQTAPLLGFLSAYAANDVDFNTDLTAKNRTAFVQTLERSQILASGTAISAQRNLQLSFNYTPPGHSIRATLFTVYAKLVSVFLDSCVVRS
jgi:hypothetical protein